MDAWKVGKMVVTKADSMGFRLVEWSVVRTARQTAGRKADQLAGLRADPKVVHLVDV